MTRSFPAPAKLNLFLHVVGRRADGYHLLQTVFRFIDFSDQLSFSVRNDGVIGRTGQIPGVAESDDLCIRAAKLLREKYGNTALGVDIELIKNIPLGGGLGGGSSDAATTLLALNRLWNIHRDRTELIKLGLELGADVPVFIYGENAFAEGVGEKLTAIDLPVAWYVVLTPPVQIPTAAVFASRELTRNTIPIKIAAFSTVQGHNDLEAVAVNMEPVIAEWLAWLRQQHGTTKVAMSGSGACVFAEFACEADAQAVFSRLPADMNGFVTRGLEKHPLSDF